MERWGFYLSGIQYGICEKEGGHIYHRPLNVETGEYGEKKELTKEEEWYKKLGKMDVLDALLHTEEYERALADNQEGFQTTAGTRYERKSETEYVERGIKFPADLLVEDGRIIAFMTPARDCCSLLVREGCEDRTLLARWKEMYQDSICRVRPVQTFMVPMRDGVRLAADVYLPEKEGPVPVVLVRTPYGKSNDAEPYYRFVQRGFGVVIQDVRGREDSEGEWLPMYYEVEDGDDTLNWIAAQPWSNGDAAMTGGSYLGYVQWAAAASGNPHLKAMLSSVCSGSPFVDVPRRGGCFNSGMLAWAFAVSGQRMDAEKMVRDDWDEVLNIRPLEDLAPKALGYDVPFLRKWISHMDCDELWQRGSWKNRFGTRRVPALIMSGWFDDNGMGTTEALDLYADYDEKKVILGPWMHSGNANYDIHGFALGNNALRYDMDLICFAWLEHHVNGVDNGIEKTPKVEYYTMGSNEWKSADNWPVPGTKELVLYLDGDGTDGPDQEQQTGNKGCAASLQEQPEGRSCAAAENRGRLTKEKILAAGEDIYLYDPEDPPVHIIDMSENELEVPEDYTEEEKRKDILCYSTQRLAKDLTITGDALAKIYISSDCEDTDLVVRITDVDENGRSMKLADGVISVRYRNQFIYPEFMEPGKVYPVEIRTTKLSHTFKKGHKLRVTVTSGAENFIFPNRNTREGFNSVEMKIAENRIHRGGEYASRVVLRQEV
ncbi:hydrolase CocE/NonD family protein [Lachnospiraceae bacterium M18-1]|nr:hydrolase CocE/NonD family protein [Lachnospiraceae bacterium M18-1]